MISETVRLRGHIIDSLLLPKVLDEIIARGGRFEIVKLNVGRKREDVSEAVVRVEAADETCLTEILRAIHPHGAESLETAEVRLAPAPADGIFPEDFYVSSNLPTQAHWQGRWLDVRPARMDCGIVVDPVAKTAAPQKFWQVRRGDLVVVGHDGVRVTPLQRPVEEGGEAFEFMASNVSTEKPKRAVIRAIADVMRAVKRDGQKILVVAGPAVVHTGAGSHLIRLVELGYVNLLFAGNALALHDIEQSLYGTALGVYLEHGTRAAHGHENHIRAVNRIRAIGGIREAIENGTLNSGIMHACVKHNVEFVLAGSIRDDGPLPEVITDAIQAQKAMAERLNGVGLALMIATMLHSIAVGNLLPATCKTVCVDINSDVVTKLSDRGSFQTIGLVTDVEPFLVELLENLKM